LRKTVYVDEHIPLIGHIAFGVIDRGTNVIQIRATTICHLNCIFCSVDAGPNSRHRRTEYIVDLDWLLEWVKAVVEIKGSDVEALIDGVGEPATYPKLIELVQGLKDIKGIRSVALQTRGYTLTYELVKELEEAGLDRINLSLDALDNKIASKLYGVKEFNNNKIIELAEYIAKETKIDLHVAPLWVPGYNDNEIPKIIEWVKRIGAGKRWPPIGIQKYIEHKYGRKPPNVREWSWSEFYSKLKELEAKHNFRLIYTSEEFMMHPAPRVPIIYRVGQRLRVEVIEDGWLKGEKLAVPKDRKRVITVIKAWRIEVGDVIDVRITRNKDNIYIAKPLGY